MTDKNKVSTSVYKIADRYNLTAVAVQEILECYFRYCKDLLVNGNRVDFYGLVSIVPDYLESTYQTTLAYECYRVADALGRPRHTTYTVIKTFLQDSIDAVKSGVVAEIRGIVSVKPVFDRDGNIVAVHSSISQLLKLKLNEVETNVTGFRVHTSKQLKGRVKSGVVV